MNRIKYCVIKTINLILGARFFSFLLKFHILKKIFFFYFLLLTNSEKGINSNFKFSVKIPFSLNALLIPE